MLDVLTAALIWIMGVATGFLIAEGPEEWRVIRAVLRARRQQPAEPDDADAERQRRREAKQ